MAGGRPIKYKPEYCDLIYKMMAEGGSYVEFCVEIGISRQTGYNWMDAYPKFLDAYTRAKEASEAYWANKISQVMLEPSQNVTPPLIKLYMANRFGWSDKTDHDVKSDVTYRVIPADEEAIDASD